MPSPQSSYEIVKRSIEFSSPERIPVRSHSHREDGQQALHFSDTFDIHSLDTDTAGWEMGMEGKDELEKRDVYNFPDPNNESRYRNIEKPLENAGDKYVLVYKHSLLFERMWYLRGLNNLMQDFLLEPEKINDVVDELISIGVDVINTFQPALLGIEEMQTKFAGRVCFETCVDIQETLPFGSNEDIKKELKEIFEKCRTPQ